MSDPEPREPHNWRSNEDDYIEDDFEEQDYMAAMGIGGERPKET